MALDGATGYDSVSGASAPSASLTDFTLYVAFTPSASWWSAYVAAGETPGRIRVTNSDGTVEYARDVLVAPTSSLVVLRVLWPGAQSGTPSLRVYPDATGSYGASDTYGQYAAYDSGVARYFPANESSGNLTDRKASASATVNGSMTLGSSGKLGSAIAPDGSDDDADPGDLSIAESKVFTYRCWMRSTQTGADRWMIAEGSTSSNTPAAGLILNSGYLRGFLRNDANSARNVVGSSTQINDDAWHHVAMTYDGSNGMILYVDGTQEASGSTVSGDVTLNASAIAALRRASVSLRYAGLLDDIWIESAARSAAWLGYEYTITNAPASFWSASGWTALATSRLLLLRRRHCT